MNDIKKSVGVPEKKCPDGQILQFGVLELGLKLQEEKEEEEEEEEERQIRDVDWIEVAGEVDDDGGGKNHNRSFLCRHSGRGNRPTFEKVGMSHVNVISSNTDDVVVSVASPPPAPPAASVCVDVITSYSNTTCSVLPSSVSSAAVVCYCDSGVATTTEPLLQPFGIFAFSASTATTSTFCHHTSPANPFFTCPGGGMAAAGTSCGRLGHPCYYEQNHPFTAAQWKELERQAMIYKYMVASIPVPSDLLFSICCSDDQRHPQYAYAPASWAKVGGGILNLTWGNAKDAEPGRCKRTDGKKWRCSKEVAPNQKYCERHLHRGRPRSRKPVEVRADFPINFNPNDHPKNAAKKTRLRGGGGVEVEESAANKNEKQTASCNFIGLSTSSIPQFDINCPAAASQATGSAIRGFSEDVTRDLCYKPVIPTTPFEKTRNFSWGMKGQENPMAATTAGGQYWHNLGQQTDMMLAIHGPLLNSSPTYFHQNQGHDEPLNLNCYPNFYTSRANPKPCVDALSNAVLHNKNDIDGGRSKSSFSSSMPKIPASSLALSMGGCDDSRVDTRGIQMDLSVPDSEFHDVSRPQALGLLNSVSSWVPPPGLTPGGPLAEALRNTVASSSRTSDPSSPGHGNGDQITPTAATISSPSGVLQKTTLASFSDSRGSTSPTWDSRKAKVDMPCRWLS